MRHAELKRELYWFRDFPTGFDSIFLAGPPARRREGGNAFLLHSKCIGGGWSGEREREREYTLMK